jgi:integrase
VSVYKPKGSPFWHYDFRFKGDRHFGSSGSTERAEAVAFEEAEKTRLRREHFFGAPKTRPTLTVDLAFGRFWQEKGQFMATADDELGRMDVLKDLIGPNTPLDRISDDMIAAKVVPKLRGRAKRGGTLVKNSTVNRYIECLRRVWRRAALVWKVEVGDEPAWGQHLLHEAAERIRELSEEEEGRLFAALRPDFRPMARFALMSGMRVGNVRRLTWKDVNYDTRTVTIRTKSRKPGGETQTVPLTSAMVALLANEKGKHPIYVFTYECQCSRLAGGAARREKGRLYPFSRDGWRKPWGEALKAAGIEDFRFHDNRHTAATRTLRASGNLKVVQKMLGHSNIATTAKYAHALTDDIREAMEAAQSRNIPEERAATRKKDGGKG